MILLMSIPIRPATFWFSAVARMAVPTLVLCTSQSSPAINAMEDRKITISLSVIVMADVHRRL